MARSAFRPFGSAHPFRVVCRLPRRPPWRGPERRLSADIERIVRPEVYFFFFRRFFFAVFFAVFFAALRFFAMRYHLLSENKIVHIDIGLSKQF